MSKNQNAEIVQALLNIVSLLQEGADVKQAAPKATGKAKDYGTFPSAKALRAAHPKAALGSTATVESAAGLGTFRYTMKSKTSAPSVHYWAGSKS